MVQTLRLTKKMLGDVNVKKKKSVDQSKTIRILKTDFSIVHVNIILIPHIPVSHTVSFQGGGRGGWGFPTKFNNNVYLPTILHRFPVSVFLI